RRAWAGAKFALIPSRDPIPSTPTTGEVCCPCAPGNHSAAPPTVRIKSRRFMPQSQAKRQAVALHKNSRRGRIENGFCFAVLDTVDVRLGSKAALTARNLTSV